MNQALLVTDGSSALAGMPGGESSSLLPDLVRRKSLEKNGWVVILIMGIIGVSITVALIKYVEFFRKKQWDEITGFAVLVDLAVTVFLAEEIKSLVPVNLILMMLLIFAGYSLMRGIIQKEENSY